MITSLKYKREEIKGSNKGFLFSHLGEIGKEKDNGIQLQRSVFRPVL